VRTLVSWLVVVGLASLAVVAVLDAVSAEPSPDATERTGTGSTVDAIPVLAADADAVAALRDGGARGVLVYVDPTCRSVELRLPTLERRIIDESPRCPPSTDEGDWTPVEEPLVMPPGCERETGPAPQGCRYVVLGARHVQRALAVGGRVTISEVAWLSGMRVAAIVRDERRRLDVLAVFERRRLVAPPSLADADLTGLRVSPYRRHIAVRSSAGGVFVLDWEGRFAMPGRFRLALLDTRAVTWSPDEAWTAVATGRRVYVVPTDHRSSTAIELPVAALGIDWR
jgi:hypothetical protein